MKKWILIISLLALVIPLSSAQEYSEGEKEHQIQLIVSHTQIHSALNREGYRKWQSLPSWGLNYNFRFSKKWKIGLHNDIIVEDFQVESLGRNEVEILDRRYPIASAAVISRKLSDHFQVLLGLGGEFAESQSFFLLRGGIEYSYQFHEKWELIGNITNDLKWNAYNSWALGLGISRSL